MEEQIDIHDFNKRFERKLQKIAEDPKIKKVNKDYINKFVDFCIVKENKKSSMTKDLYSIWFFAHNLNKDFKKANKNDFNKLILLLEKQKWTKQTKRVHRVSLKKFMKWLKGNNKFYPPEVEDIESSRKNLGSYLPDEILTPKEVEQMIGSATDIRDKTLIMFLAFTGTRIGEALNVKIKNCRFQETGEVIVLVNGKTGYRTVVSIPLSSALANYIENGHPTKNPDDYLFMTNHNMTKGRTVVGKIFDSKLGKEREIGKTFWVPLSYAGSVKVLKNLAEKAGVVKKVSPHWFRRYAATEDSKYMSDRLMMLKFGWNTPEQVGTYSKLSAQSLIEVERKRHGKVVENDGKPELTVIACPRCKSENLSPPASKFCSKCGMVLSFDTVMKLDARRKESDEKMNKLLEDGEVQEFLKKKIIELKLDS